MQLLSFTMEELPEFELGCFPEITLRREIPTLETIHTYSAEQEGDGGRGERG